MQHPLLLPLSLLSALLGYSAAALAQPALTAVTPARNAGNVVRTSAVTARFDQPLDAASTQGLKLYSAQRGGLRTGHSGSTAVTGNALVFTPTYAWQPGESVTAVGTRAVRNQSGQALQKPFVSQFTVAAGGPGQGNFQPGSEADGGDSYSTDVVTADVDGDGDLDLFVADQNRSQVGIRLNGGDASGSNTGRFSGGQNVNVRQGRTTGLAVGDIDGDGDFDFVAANGYEGGVSVQLNGGDNSGSNTGLFSPSPDLAFGVGTELKSLALADIDGDGDLDLLAVNSYLGRVYVRLNGGDATGSNTGRFSGTYFADINYQLLSLAVADVDGDGDLDLIAANALSVGTVTIGLNGGDNSGSNTGTFSRSQEVVVGDLPRSIAVGDLDGDGDVDFAVANGNKGTVSVRLNGGDASGSNTGRFSGAQEVAVGGRPASLALGDVDGDGDLDLVVADANQPTQDYNNNTARVLLNGGDGTGNGSGVFANGFDTTVGPAPVAVRLADVDGDGDLDLLALNTRSAGGSSVSVRLNTAGGGTLSSSVQAVCAGANAGTLTLAGAPGTIVAYQADRGTGYQAMGGTTATLAFANLTATTTFRAVVRTPYNQLVYSAPVTVTVNPTPVAALAADGALVFCQGGAVTLTASGGGAGSTYQFLRNGGAVPGATGSALRVTSSGTYAVRVTNPTGCSAVSVPVATTVQPLTTATFAYDGASFCQGGADPTPAVTGTAGGVFTAATGLVLDAATGRIAVASSPPGTYAVTYAVGGPCPSSSTVSVAITQAPTAAFSYPRSSYCANETAPQRPAGTGATAGGAFTSTPGLALDAATGAVTPSGSMPGNYVVAHTVAAAGGCAAATATAAVAIAAAPVAALTAATATTFCQGGAVVLTAPAGAGNTYQFRRDGIDVAGATAATYTATAGGAYAVVVTNAGGCAETSSSTVVVVNARPAPPVLTAQYNGPVTTLVSSAAVGNQFYLNGTPIAGATASTYVVNTPAQLGAYTAVVTDGRGCASEASAPLTVTAGRQPLAGTAVHVYPNPTRDGHLRVALTGYRRAAELTVLNALGQVVFTVSVPPATGPVAQPVNLAPFAAGIYLLRVTTEGGLDSQRIVKE